jgi:tetratricopeptide (TPR) repeat protein
MAGKTCYFWRMRRVLAGLVLLALPCAVGCSAHVSLSVPPAAPVAAPKLPADPASWLPAYSPQQLALLAPTDHPIQAPAQRVLPDLGRFWYANNRKMEQPEEAFRFTKMVATILNDSPRFYALDAAPPELANPIVQYGPPPEEPDGFSIAKRGDDGVGELQPAPGAGEARVDFDKGAAAQKSGDPTAELAALRAAIAKGPKVPAVRAALGEALAAAGKAAEAEAAFNEAIAVDPTYAPPYFGLSDLLEKRGDAAGARKALVEGLAYQPNASRGAALVRRLGGGGRRVMPFAIFLDVDAAGAIHVATQEKNPAQMYGGCRAVMRYEPDVRAQIFEQPPETPYYLSVVEEVICLEAALGAYMVERKEDADEPPDGDLEALLDLAREEGLSGYVMFEILGQHRPERARVAPPEVHRAVARYVERNVFGQKAAPAGVYTVDRGHDRDGDGDEDEQDAQKAIEQRVREAVREAAKAVHKH